MKVEDLIDLVDRPPGRVRQMQMVVPLNSFHIRIGGVYCTQVKDAHVGIDWDSNKLILKTSEDIYSREDIESKLGSLGWGDNEIEDFFKKQ